ncbi:MAG TPA: Xaa-Pro dipeptidase [Steroidobacteraceae bacterium]|nr:Xaa-Pro dipeptidase [Steroidobacteraceae bacterium]
MSADSQPPPTAAPRRLDLLYPGHVRVQMQRADQALAASGFDALEIHSGHPPIQFLDDQDYPFKVNPHFKAWVPVADTPGCILLYTPGRRPKLLFPQTGDYWYQVSPLPSDSWTQEVEVLPLRDGREAQAHRAGLGRTARIGPAESCGDAAAEDVNPPDLLTRLHYDRAVKTDYEIECLRRANRLGVRGHRAALAAFREGRSEYAAQQRYLEACAQREEEMPYNNIVAYNEHAAILHYQRLERAAPTQLRSLLIDAGAQFCGYAADITRSHAAGDGVYADLILEMDNLQRALCGQIVAGTDYRQVHLIAHRAIGDLLHRSGITKVPGEAAIERRVTGVFFPHGIGHLLGLQVHDVGGVLTNPEGQECDRPPGHPNLRLTRRLQPGVVVTVEPGIYFIDTLLAAARGDTRADAIDWPTVEALRPYGGIRIEDDVVTTAAQPENLTRDAFASLAD